MAPSLVSNSRK